MRSVEAHAPTEASPETAIRILCVDDHAVVREGIAVILDLQPDMKVVASAGSGVQAVNLFDKCRPDVTLMDLQLPAMSGLEAIRAIRRRHPDARIIVLTMYQGDESIYQALRAGATTYLLKETLSKDLVRIIREVHAGGRPISADIAARLNQRASHPQLTSRELAVLTLIAKGLRNKEIATTLGVAEETVHSHLKNIFSKWEVQDRQAAVYIAIRRGIIHIE
jgi:DNA-binding NarL/FixJ family response regulator